MNTVELANSAVSVEAALIAGDLGLEPEHVLEATRAGRLTALCERGTEQDAGRVRVTFYHANRRLRLVIDEMGRVLERSTARVRQRRRRQTAPDRVL